jgi:NADH-quinone oxidoreductase subunit M
MILTLLIFLPAAGAVLAGLLPREEHGQLRVTALGCMLATFAISLWAWGMFDPSPRAPEFQLEAQAAWSPAIGFSYHVGIDGIALVLIVLTTFLTPLALLSAFQSIKERVKEFVIAMLLLECAMLGTLAAIDLVLFYFFWEAMLLPMYLLIGVWGGERRVYAAVKFFIYTMAGSLLMLVAILYLYYASGGAGSRTFDLPAILAQAPWLSTDTQRWLFLAFALSFAIKVPMFPLHTWLPDAHVEAPAAGSIILAGVLLKMGTFGFLRYAFPLFPEAAVHYRVLLAVLAVIGILYGSLMCLAQSDLKRLVAYSSVSHLGFVMLGLCALTVEGMSGGIYQMLNHGISTGALFALVGILYERRHTREMSQYGGLAKSVPALAAVFLIITLSSIGLPGTNGFVGEFLILAGSFNSKLTNAPWYAACGALGVILGAVYMLWMYQRVFFGPVKHKENEGLSDLSGREWTVLTPLVAMVIVMGVFPAPFLDRIEPAAARLVSRLEATQRAKVGTPPASMAMFRTPNQTQIHPPPRRPPFGQPGGTTPFGAPRPGAQFPLGLPKGVTLPRAVDGAAP